MKKYKINLKEVSGGNLDVSGALNTTGNVEIIDKSSITTNNLDSTKTVKVGKMDMFQFMRSYSQGF
jgi:hypothetical protein